MQGATRHAGKMFAISARSSLEENLLKLSSATEQTYFHASCSEMVQNDSSAISCVVVLLGTFYLDTNA